MNLHKKKELESLYIIIQGTYRKTWTIVANAKYEDIWKEIENRMQPLLADTGNGINVGLYRREDNTANRQTLFLSKGWKLREDATLKDIDRLLFKEY